MVRGAELSLCVLGCTGSVGCSTPRMLGVESVVRGHCECWRLSLARVLKLASALCSLRNVTHTCYLGNRVTVGPVQCAKLGRTEGLWELRLVRQRGGSQSIRVCVCGCVGDGCREDDCLLSVISWSLIRWPPCLVVRRLNTHTHTFKQTNTQRAIAYPLSGSCAKS